MRNIIKELTIESKELNIKLAKLVLFINAEKFESLCLEHQRLLLNQQSAMQRYTDILRDRIKLLEEGK